MRPCWVTPRHGLIVVPAWRGRCCGRGKRRPPTGLRRGTSCRVAATYADLEFLAGFIALRELGDAEYGADAFRALASRGA